MIAPSDLEEDFMFRTLLATGLLAATCPARCGAGKARLERCLHGQRCHAVVQRAGKRSRHDRLRLQQGQSDCAVGSYIGSKGLKADEPARIILSAGKVKKTFTGKAGDQRGKRPWTWMEAGATFDDVKAVLSGGKLMTIEVKA